MRILSCYPFKNEKLKDDLKARSHIDSNKICQFYSQRRVSHYLKAYSLICYCSMTSSLYKICDLVFIFHCKHALLNYFAASNEAKSQTKEKQNLIL